MLGEKGFTGNTVTWHIKICKLMINKHSNISVGVYCNIFVIYHNAWSIRKEERYNPMRLRNLKDFYSWIYMCAYTFPSKTRLSHQAQCPFLSSSSWNAQDNLVLPTWRADDDSAILFTFCRLTVFQTFKPPFTGMKLFIFSFPDSAQMFYNHMVFSIFESHLPAVQER